MLMLLRWPGIFPAVAALALAADRHSTPWHYRTEFFVSAGRGQAGSGRGSWGSGRDFGAGVGFRPFPGSARALGFEAQVAALSNEDTGVISQKLESLLAAGNIVYHFFSEARAQPYLSAGAGFLKADYTRTCTGCVFNLDPATGQLTPIVEEQFIRLRRAVFTVGAGIKIAVHQHFWLRPEIFGSGGDKRFVRYRLSVGFHF